MTGMIALCDFILGDINELILRLIFGDQIIQLRGSE